MDVTLLTKHGLVSNVTSIIKCEMNSLIHSQAYTVQALKFGKDK